MPSPNIGNWTSHPKPGKSVATQFTPLEKQRQLGLRGLPFYLSSKDNVKKQGTLVLRGVDECYREACRESRQVTQHHRFAVHIHEVNKDGTALYPNHGKAPE